jgi:hypothetical protein
MILASAHSYEGKLNRWSEIPVLDHRTAGVAPMPALWPG